MRRIEHFDSLSASHLSFKCRYVGSAFYLSDRIFLIEKEQLTRNEITETILFPTQRNKVGRLSGLILGVSSSEERRIACSRVFLEWLGTSINIRKALKPCGLFDPRAREIDPQISTQIDNTMSSTPLFYTTRS